MSAEIINLVSMLAKAVFLLAASVFVLGLVVKRFKPKPPPCASCKHLEMYYKNRYEPWKCRKRATWYGNGLKYCVDFEPREEDEEDDEEDDEEEDDGW